MIRPCSQKLQQYKNRLVRLRPRAKRGRKCGALALCV
ncbi:hypothetical protein EII16_03170 [Campylobacter rectus]|nr:hypothetical protein EII16_03170 [Campylobacter rectus]